MQSLNIDALICWPESTDYSYFRASLPLLTGYVKPTICITPQGNSPVMGNILLDLTEKDCHILKSHNLPHNQYPGDWRSAATNYMLDNTLGEYVLSLEQDFFIYNYPHFFYVVTEALKTYDAVVFEEGNRYHPAFLLAKREAVNATKRDFSTAGVGLDHFAVFTKQLKGLGLKVVTLQELGLVEQVDWWHMRGLTDNYFAPKPYFDLPSFYAYNKVCIDLAEQEYLAHDMDWYTKMTSLDLNMPPEIQINDKFYRFLKGI